MSVFSDLKVQNYANRNGFDLGRFSSFSAKAGQILPVFLQSTLPSSDYSLDIKQLLRTQPLQKAAFTGFSINYDVIWCPYNHLYSSFNQFIAQREDKNMVSQPSHQHIPTFDFQGFCKYLFYLGLYDYIMSFVRPKGQIHSMVIQPYAHVFSVNSSPSESAVLEVIRMLDMLEYTNLLPLIKNAYATLTNYTWDNQGETLTVDWTAWELDDTPQTIGVAEWFLLFCDGFSPSSILTPNDVYNAMRYPFSSNQIKINPSKYTPDEFIGDLAYRPNLFAVLAYNKMFYEYYRSQYYDDLFVISTPFFDSRVTINRTKSFKYVQLFNYDDFVDGLSVTSARLTDGELFLRLLAMFYPKHHLYKKDLFTAILPSTQMGDVSMMVTDNDFSKLIGNSSNLGQTVGLDSGQFFSVYSEAGINKVQERISPTSSQSVRSDKFKFDPALAISVLESRRADAMQRFKERMMRSGHKVKDIFKGQGWETPKSEKSYEPIFLGSFDGRLDINVVAATAETSDINLGQLAGNGMAKVDGHKIKIHTSDFGVLMVLFHIEKDAVYDAYGFNIQHTLVEPFDFPYPVLQNISLAPVAPEYVNLFNLVDTEKKPIGYLPRAIGWKTAVDKTHGEFYSSVPFAVETRGNETIPGLPFVTGAFSDWVAPREDINHPDLLRFLYVQAQCCDMIFVQSANERQDSDPFLVNARFDCYAVEPLPVIGLPQ